MMEEASPQFRDAAAPLMQGEGHRVWSLIVSIFGDLAQREGDSISGPVLSRLTGLMGVKPQAMRVALHRLRKDGWIESARDGRASSHVLTSFGRAQSAAASPRIYGAAPADPGRWHLLAAGGPDGQGAARLAAFLDIGGYHGVNAMTILGAGPLPGDHRGLLGAELDTLAVPDWLKRRVCPPDLEAACQELSASFDTLAGMLGRDMRWPADERAALRALAVHSWRRVILRAPDLPEQFFPESWPGAACRRRFLSLMAQLPAPTPDHLAATLIRADSIPADPAQAPDQPESR